ncbi:MAG: UrcA family protein [Pseudomonadales bacterium]|nr:UrcA family protein [Pseudomonadales bacterium]
MRKHIYSIAVAVAFAVPTLASADVEVETIDESKVIVSYELTEAATAKGRAQLERQIKRAAERVCGPQDLRRAGTLAEMMNNRACLKESVASAMNSLDGKSRAKVAVFSN